MNLKALRNLVVLFVAVVFTCPPANGQELKPVPICPPGLFSNPPFPLMTDSFTNPTQPVIVPSYVAASLGADRQCASQNWAGPDGDDYSYPQAVHGYAEPEVVNITSFPTTVTFKVDGLSLGGPFDVNLFPCFPHAGGADGDCYGDIPKINANMAFRRVNGVGEFEGKWTLITQANNPGFLFTQLKDCPSGTPGITHPSQGVPCAYRLDFTHSPEGIPVLQEPLQVAIFTNAGSGVDPGPFLISNSHSANIAIPMLFIPGSSTSIDASAEPSSIAVGEKSVISFMINGGVSPSSNATLAVEYSTDEGATWKPLESVVANSEGFASLMVSPSVTTRYRAVLTGSGLGDKVTSKIVEVEVDGSSSPTPTPSGDGNTTVQTVNEQLSGLISQVETLISQIQSKLTKDSKTEQKSLRATLKELASQIESFVLANSADVITSSSKFNLAKSAKTAARKLKAFAKAKKKAFAKKKRGANGALRKLLKGIS